MLSTWMSVIVILLPCLKEARSEGIIPPCARVQTAHSVVSLGSPVTATCVVRDHCLVFFGRGAQIRWHLGDQLVPGRPVANGSDIMASEVVIQSFNHTRAILTCSVQASPTQVVGGVAIRAGYPPEPPRNLSCQTNLTNPNSMTCHWVPGQREPHLFTQYTLHTKIWDQNKNYTYKVPTGTHHYVIPRSGFVLFSEMEIYVKTLNELGEATSAPLVLEPVSVAKFDPPKILTVETVSKKFGCLKLSWSLSRHQTWMCHNRFNLDIRQKTADSGQWIEQASPERRVRPAKPVDLCRLRHGTRYSFQIRVRYQRSPWSEWSGSQSGVTLESAPAGRLDTWMKPSGDHVHKQLFWKPSKQFHANSQNVSYVVSLQKVPGEKGKLCSTEGNCCSFVVPRKAKKVYLTAVSAAGRSLPTEVRIYQTKVAHTAISDIAAIPHDDRGFLVQWKAVDLSGLAGFVVEWMPLLETDPSFTQFEIVDRNQSSLFISGSFEPYKPYGISVYPRFKEGMGLPRTVKVYSRQKAPSMVPKIQRKNTWRSHIELTWEEIPLQQRNGIIQSYRVFYWKEKGPVKAVNADVQERKVVLKDLDTLCSYEGFMMVSTMNGSRNGSMIHFEIEPFDAVTVFMIVIALGVGLSLMVIFTVMCWNHKRLKGRFWPAVPDPANSSIKRWPSETSQNKQPPWDREEPNPVYLSHLSFLDLPLKLSKQEDDSCSNSAEDTSDLGESICGSPFLPGYSGSNSESVPYATVIFSGPCSSPPPTEPHTYLRSESTQPLLEADESFTPQCYQNVATEGRATEQCFFGPGDDYEVEEGADPAIMWDDFPFLQALATFDNQND